MRRKVSYKILSIIFSLLLLLPGNVVIAASITASLTNRTELSELDINGAVVRVSLTGDSFKSTIDPARYSLVNEPTGTTIKSITWINNQTVDITLNFNGQDFDADKTNFYIKVFKEALVNQTADLITANMIIEAVIESITYETNPSPLKETNLNGSNVTITILNDMLEPTLSVSDFSIHNPAGMGIISIGAVERLSDSQAKLTLSYDGKDFDSNKTDFRITLLGTGILRTSVNLVTSDITIYYEQEQITATSTNPNPLIETSLANAVITLTLTADTYIAEIDATYFQLVNPVPGISIARIDRLSSMQVNLILDYDGTDFDADKTNFAVKLFKEGLVRTTTDLHTNPMTIRTIVETGPSIMIHSHPSQLYELTLTGSSITLILREDDFNAVLTPAYFRLNNAPSGTSIAKVIFVDTHSVILELSYGGQDFDVDITNFCVTALGTALVSGSTLTSNSLTVIANKEVEGEGKYTVTGQSYPTRIVIAGYNIRDNKIYINAELETIKTILEGQNAEYKYFIEIFNSDGSIIGRKGSFESPISVIGTNIARVQNIEVALTALLTSSYRIVITVASVIPI